MRTVTLGSLLSRFQDDIDAGRMVEALGDIVLFSELQTVCARHGETPGEYVSGAASRFAAASGEDWLALMTAVGRSEDPARTALQLMLRWSLAQDARGEISGDAGSVGGCGH
jgi:hypothetical protein